MLGDGREINLGWSSLLADVDGDDLVDIILGAPNADDAGIVANTGATHILFGASL